MSPQQPETDAPHYGGPNNPYEAIKVIHAWGVGFCLGNTLKYICRAGKKPGETTLKDLKKAAWYLNEHIRDLEVRTPQQVTQCLDATATRQPRPP